MLLIADFKFFWRLLDELAFLVHSYIVGDFKQFIVVITRAIKLAIL